MRRLRLPVDEALAIGAVVAPMQASGVRVIVAARRAVRTPGRRSAALPSVVAMYDGSAVTCEGRPQGRDAGGRGQFPRDTPPLVHRVCAGSSRGGRGSPASYAVVRALHFDPSRDRRRTAVVGSRPGARVCAGFGYNGPP